MMMVSALGDLRPPVYGSGPVEVARTDEVLDRVMRALGGRSPRGVHPRHVALVLLYYDGSSARVAELRRLTKVRREYLFDLARMMGYTPAVTRKGWSDRELSFLQEHYGEMRTERLARILGRSGESVRQKARRLGLSILENQGCYSSTRLARLLGIDPHVITRQWMPLGLHTFSYRRQAPLYMVDPEALLRFWRRRPEAYDWTSLPQARQGMLGLLRESGRPRLPSPPLEKLVACRAQTRRNRENGRMVGADFRGAVNVTLCGARFWVDLYERYPRCPQCGRLVSPWAIDYRGEVKRERRRAAYDDAAVPVTALGAIGG